MNDPRSPLPLSFRLETSRAGVIFVTVVIGLLGGFLLVGFFATFSNPGPDDWFVGIFGAGLLAFDVLLLRYFNRPGITLTGSSMLLSRLWGVRQVRYADLAGLSAYLEKIHPPLINGTRMPPRIIHRLVVKPRQGKEYLVTLPGFGNNERLIQALALHSGLPVERLPDVYKGR